MTDFIKEFYYGNIDPQARSIKQSKAVMKEMQTLNETEEYLTAKLKGTEKIHAPEEWKRRAARKLADNGADLVVGGHPHVLQPREVYKGVEIVYSIGAISAMAVIC